ncbi:hypothetical protein INR49_016981 [Caranx melampygus]|nr:hypothetical protein INR49_016981 [Caranx melampygus]
MCYAEGFLNVVAERKRMSCQCTVTQAVNQRINQSDASPITECAKGIQFQSTCSLCRESHKTQKSDAMLYAPSVDNITVRSTKVMAFLALSTTSITHSFNLVTRGHSCSLQSPVKRDGMGIGEKFIFSELRTVLLGSLEELVRQACDEGLEEAHGAEYLLSFGCVLWRVVDTLETLQTTTLKALEVGCRSTNSDNVIECICKERKESRLQSSGDLANRARLQSERKSLNKSELKYPR